MSHMWSEVAEPALKRSNAINSEDMCAHLGYMEVRCWSKQSVERCFVKKVHRSAFAGPRISIGRSG